MVYFTSKNTFFCIVYSQHMHCVAINFKPSVLSFQICKFRALCYTEQTGSFFNNCSLSFQTHNKRSYIILKKNSESTIQCGQWMSFIFTTALPITKQVSVDTGQNVFIIIYQLQQLNFMKEP